MLIKNIISNLLRLYDPKNPELFLKAKFLLVTTATAIFGLTATLAYTSYTFGINSTTVMVELFGFAIMLSALIALIKGHYSLAGHTILITGFVVVWVIMFTEPLTSELIKLDTIVFILVLLSLVPLIFFKNKRPLLLYFLINFAIFGIFNFYLFKQGNLSQREFVDYFLDNTIAMFFIIVIALNLFKIYSQALSSLENELSEKEKAEKNLQTEKQKLYVNEERLRLAMQATQQSWFDLNLKTMEVTTSPEFVNIVGAETEASRTSYQAWIESIHNNDRDAVLECFSDCLKTGEIRQMEYRMITRNGEWKWIHSSAKVVAFDEANMPTRMTGTHMDITERKIAEETLQKSESQLKEAQKIAKLGYFEYDFQKDTIWCSDQTYGILELKIADIPPNHETLIKRLSENDIDKLRNLVGRAEKYGEDYSISCNYQIPDGELKHIDLHAKVVFNENGKPKGLKGTILDVTEKNKIQNQLNQSQKMQAIGTLAGGVAHDFNNVLSAIFGYTDLALMQAKNDSRIEKYLHEIMKAGKRAKDLINQILTVARKKDKMKVSFSVADATDETLKLLRSSFPSSIEINQKIESKSLVTGDPSQIHQILMNLCTNASHAMEEKAGLLEVSVLDVIVSSKYGDKNSNLSPGNYVKIVVSDNGIGISSDKIKSIFEPYYTTKKPGEGTGLGLAIVHGIVEAHNGEILVDSTLGEGTTFTVYLPISQKIYRQLTNENGDLPKGNEHILFVDDEETIVETNKNLLKKLGYSVLAKTNSKEALDLFQARPDDFDLVITDMTMPYLTGEKLAEKVRNIKSNIPIIICTGYSKKITNELVSELGINAVFYKPLTFRNFAISIRNVLDEVKNSQIV